MPEQAMQFVWIVLVSVILVGFAMVTTSKKEQ